MEHICIYNGTGCRIPNYGPHESRIIMEHVQALIKNDWIEECHGPWGSLIVLAPKPHQEHVEDINDFVWRMCVSYRALNEVTKPFTYLIPRCDNAVGSLGSMMLGDNTIFVSLDAKQGYHQISVKESDREKLAFFAPNGVKYTFKVMPFGPTNAPAFYTCMMHDLQNDWDKLFLERMQSMAMENTDITIKDDKSIYINQKKLVIGSKVIIDDILAFANIMKYLLSYVDCICTVFKKYRVSFQLKKCDFLKDRVEYVGHDLTATGNCPAQSKFELIRNWELPTAGPSLHSFIGLLNFYHKYIPFFELTVKPLRALERKFHRKPIPESAWSEDLKALFEELKDLVTSSPLLIRYDPMKPVFLKTDWSSYGMGFILCQPDNSKESVEAIKKLEENQECLFDLSSDGVRLQPLAFGSKSCTEAESHFHSFVGEVACGRWAISQNKHYLWGRHFYWLCDCNSVKEILNYTGSIHMLSRWSMELLGYSFSIIHRPARMMMDADCLARRYTPAFRRYANIAVILLDNDMKARPLAYSDDYFKEKQIRIRNSLSKDEHGNIPIFHSEILESKAKSIYDMNNAKDKSSQVQPAGAPILLHTLPPATSISKDTVISTAPGNLSISDATDCVGWNRICWLSIDDIACTLALATKSISTFDWNIMSLFTCIESNYLCNIVQDITGATVDKLQVSSLQEFVDNESYNSFKSLLCGCDITYIPGVHGNIIPWLTSTLASVTKLLEKHKAVQCIQLWVPVSDTIAASESSIINNIEFIMPVSWDTTVALINTAHFNSAIFNEIRCFIISPNNPNNDSFKTVPSISEINKSKCNFSQYINNNANYNVINNNECYSLPPQLVTAEIAGTHREFMPRELVSIKSQGEVVALIMDPEYPIYIPNIKYGTKSINVRCGVPIWNEQQDSWICRPISNHEYLNALIDRQAVIEADTCIKSLNLDAVSICICACIPKSTHICLLEHWINEGQFDDIIFNEGTQIDSIQCFTVKAVPNKNNWQQAYEEDIDTRQILQMISTGVKIVNRKQLKTIHQAYHPHMMDNNISIDNGKLILTKPLPLQGKAIKLIIVPRGLRRLLFEHYHGGPTGGHMGEFKTLHRLRVRFFWPRMRKDISDWVQQCGQCIAAKSWKQRKNDLYFSWPVTVPFWIIHCDLWSPGATVDKEGNLSVLNCMCDLTQFIVSSVIKETTAEALSIAFMENVVLKYGVCAVIVVDAGSNFRHIFEQMCDILDITFWPLARGNHHGLSVERYHRYLNKTQTIQGASIGTHENFKRNVLISAYGWNSAPIDGTNIVRSIPAVGREFRFPLDTKTAPVPPLNDLQHSELLPYLREIGSESETAVALLELLINDRREQHRKRHNSSKTPCNLKVGDVVTAHVQVKSNSKTGEVSKLSYKARGPFIIVADKGFGTFEVRQYNNPTAPTRLYKGIDLYILPPAIFPSNPIDATDQRYLNYEHAPLASPLKQSLQIDAYNDTWFQHKPTTTPDSSKQHYQPYIDHIALSEHNIQLSSPEAGNEGSQDNGNDHAPVEQETINESFIPLQPQTLYSDIQASKDKLFFIQYIPAGTIRAKWYLVQVDMELTMADKNCNPMQGIFQCSFLAKHAKDQKKSDERSRWWPDWYSYKICSQSQEIIYGKRVQIRPSVTPDSSKYILWATALNLTSQSTFIHGPFNFNNISSTQRAQNMVHEADWKVLHQYCRDNLLLPPTLGSESYTKPNLKRKKRKSPTHAE